ncbi:Transglycosylase SLT domain-containing protein [Balnearium lithotrophicum]|uniref:Transglycosylase SLT domain-containing protein n=1 Tax=Balnearium lithotrophicum TaxID=223788 RepID=A0A521B176_9BACT|nr:lytic transglycosylase domain-containing protein [Balnearium lithotrophicum]SMO40827.1 Transglycosylase SLT domain-containing protein [Balnearium lithotrophicum]
MEILRRLSLCIFLISFISTPAFGWIRIFEKNGVIYIKGVGENKFEKPKNFKILEKKADFYAKKYGIPVKLFRALVKAESNFNPRAVSKKGALGLCQLMPETAKELGVKNPFDPDENLNAGALLLSRLYKKYRDWRLALAAYNAGEGVVDRYGGIPPYRETISYVKNISREYRNQGKSNRRYRIVLKREGNVIVISQKFE